MQIIPPCRVAHISSWNLPTHTMNKNFSCFKLTRLMSLHRSAMKQIKTEHCALLLPSALNGLMMIFNSSLEIADFDRQLSMNEWMACKARRISKEDCQFTNCQRIKRWVCFWKHLFQCLLIQCMGSPFSTCMLRIN